MKELTIQSSDGRCEHLHVIKEGPNGFYIACSATNGNIILVDNLGDGECKCGAVNVARHIEPERIPTLVEFLRSLVKDNDNATMKSALSFMVLAFLERIICRMGEGDEELQRWMNQHKDIFKEELPTAWEAVKANHAIRDVDRARFDINRAEKIVNEILA